MSPIPPCTAASVELIGCKAQKGSFLHAMTLSCTRGRCSSNADAVLHTLMLFFHARDAAFAGGSGARWCRSGPFRGIIAYHNLYNHYCVLFSL
jgi:hypothetical protein